MAAFRLAVRVRFIEEYMEFIKAVQNEIRYSGNYLENILKNQNQDGIFYPYLKKCLTYISDGKPFPVAWEKTFSSAESRSIISEDLSRIIIGFGLKLGTNDIEGQMSHCEYSYNLAIPYLQRAREEKRTKGKLYRVFGICISSAVALLLI